MINFLLYFLQINPAKGQIARYIIVYIPIIYPVPEDEIPSVSFRYIAYDGKIIVIAKYGINKTKIYKIILKS